MQSEDKDSQRPPEGRPQSAIQAAGQATNSIIDALKSEPMLLALIIFVVVFGALNYWFVKGVIAMGAQRTEKILEMLAACEQRSV